MKPFKAVFTPRGNCALLLALAVATASLAALGASAGAARAEPNTFEQRAIETQALEAFRAILGLWKEELYFELYDSGMETTKSRISREAFAQRMVELSWVPVGDLNPKFLKTRFRFRTMIYLTARLHYRHKFNPKLEFSKDHTFLLLEEAGTWRVDLIRLIRSPFA